MATPSSRPPKKRGKAAGIIGLLIFVGAIAAIVNAAHGSGASGGSTSNDNSGSSSGHTVTYSVTGTSGGADITYTTDGSVSTSQDQGASLPWSKTLTISGFLNTYQVSAQNASDAGVVSCSITVDGAVVKTASASGAYAIADCVS